MRFLFHAAFALTLAAFATGLIRPVHDARLDAMRGEFAALHPFAGR
jgi:hypothetical protein